MAADPLYFDTSYLVRLYLEDAHFERVRSLAAGGGILASSWHAQAEIIAALHRAFREGRLVRERYMDAFDQFKQERDSGHFRWCDLTEAVRTRVEMFFANASATTHLRAADALHLACAAEHGFREVYSNDRHLLAATPLFGMKGINVIGSDAP
ncbi:MAG: type II toxin-antitoxin system VapC family toxin [Chthoniobacteraceae bacterium]